MEKNNEIRKMKGRTSGLVLRGLCMGIADVIPGVSGGTIALIMGIYDELVQTIASIDRRLLKALVRFKLREVLRLLNAGFLLPLLFGIVLAIALFAKIITYLLTTFPQPVWGFFTGLIVASAIYVFRQIEGKLNSLRLITLLLGACFGYGVTLLMPVETGTESFKFVLAGMIAICAMILPGISGSFLLVIMGKYEQVFSAVHEGNIEIILLFVVGAVSGLLIFSRLLKRLLLRHQAITMAFLVGLMLGSVRKVWPFRKVVEERLVGSKVLVLQDECIFPSSMTNEVWVTSLLAVGGFVLVFLLERLGSRQPS